jgi:glycosyltransferase involved in cell wall biosynthesis
MDGRMCAPSTPRSTSTISRRPPAGPPSARLVFVGSLDWLPNEDAIEHFVSDIWPLIRAAHPGVACDIVGRNPSPAVVRLARAPGLHLVPNVPDVRPYLAGGAVAIVPLRIGGGTRLKVFEAMAMQKAVVSTSIGVEGLPVTSGSHLLIADGAAAFAEAAGSLLQDATLRERLAADGRRFVVERFSAETVARQFEAICLEAIERGARRRRSAAA